MVTPFIFIFILRITFYNRWWRGMAHPERDCTCETCLPCERKSTQYKESILIVLTCRHFSIYARTDTINVLISMTKKSSHLGNRESAVVAVIQISFLATFFATILRRVLADCGGSVSGNTKMLRHRRVEPQPTASSRPSALSTVSSLLIELAL